MPQQRQVSLLVGVYPTKVTMTYLYMFTMAFVQDGETPYGGDIISVNIVL